MLVLLTFVVLISAIAAAVGFAVSVLVSHVPRLDGLASASMTIAALLPILPHIRMTTGYAAGWENAGMYPALAEFRRNALLGVFATMAVVTLIALTARFLPPAARLLARLFTSMVPLAAGYAYLRVLVPTMLDGPRGRVLLDNIPNVWLGVFIIAGTIALMVYHARTVVKVDAS